MKLYHCPQSRSGRVLWLLEEMSLPYSLKVIDVFNKEGRTKEYLRINPYGTVPTFEDDGVVINESGAICCYVTAKFPEKKMAPEQGTADYAKFLQWMFYVPGTLEPPMWNILAHTKLFPENFRIPALVDLSKPKFKRVAKILDRSLAGKDYILGDQFTAADIMISNTLNWLPELFSDFSHIESYQQRLQQRPAFIRASEL